MPKERFGIRYRTLKWTSWEVFTGQGTDDRDRPSPAQSGQGSLIGPRRAAVAPPQRSPYDLRNGVLHLKPCLHQQENCVRH